MEIEQSLSQLSVTSLRIVEIEDVVVQDLVSCGLSLERIKNLPGLLVKSLANDVLKEVWLGDSDSILYQSLTVLLIEERVDDSEVRHVSLLCIRGVSQGS